jgi:hypothetical protein
MNIFALTVTPSLNYFATKPIQMNLPPAPTATMALKGYSPPSLPFPKALKEHPPQLVEAPPVAHAPLRVVTPAKHSSLMRETEESSS